MMQNFTPRAQQVMALAQKEAERFDHNYVGTEHLLLGLIKLGQGGAAQVLRKLNLDLETVRMEVEKHARIFIHSRLDSKMGAIPYTPRVKKALKLAAAEARALNHSYVGTEHILLGLLREGEGVAALVLKILEVDNERARNEILKDLVRGAFQEQDAGAAYLLQPALALQAQQAAGAESHPSELPDMFDEPLPPCIPVIITIRLAGHLTVETTVTEADYRDLQAAACGDTRVCDPGRVADAWASLFLRKGELSSGAAQSLDVTISTVRWPSRRAATRELIAELRRMGSRALQPGEISPILDLLEISHQAR